MKREERSFVVGSADGAGLTGVVNEGRESGKGRRGETKHIRKNPWRAARGRASEAGTKTKKRGEKSGITEKPTGKKKQRGSQVKAVAIVPGLRETKT